METKNLLKAIAVFAITIVLSGLAMNGQAQNRRNAVDCTQISNLSQKQNKEINQLKADHLKIMDELRAKRRATRNSDDKLKVREEMQVELNRYEAAVNKVLTPEQRAQYKQNKNSNRQSYARRGNRGGSRNCQANSCGQANRGKGRRGNGCRGRGNI